MPRVHYDVHLLLRRVLTSNPLGFLTDIVATLCKISLARSMFGTVELQPAEGFLFLGRPKDRFAVVGTYVPTLP